MGADGIDQLDAGEYCRLVEAYLCRKNDGHLIRLAGPSFTKVLGWAAQGVPLNAVYRGIDRYFDRYYSKGPRRRPVHIDFCEGDVLDVFDEWRRAVGVFDAHVASRPPRTGAPRAGREAAVAPEDASSPTAVRPDRHPSLPVHLERVITRLTGMRTGGRLSPAAHAAVDAAVRELDLLKGRAGQARGEHRAEITARLAALDGEVLATLQASLAPTDWRTIEDEARAELARFKQGMPGEAYERAVAASTERLLRDRFGLPNIRYEEGPQR